MSEGVLPPRPSFLIQAFRAHTQLYTPPYLHNALCSLTLVLTFTAILKPSARFSMVLAMRCVLRFPPTAALATHSRGVPPKSRVKCPTDRGLMQSDEPSNQSMRGVCGCGTQRLHVLWSMGGLIGRMPMPLSFFLPPMCALDDSKSPHHHSHTHAHMLTHHSCPSSFPTPHPHTLHRPPVCHDHGANLNAGHCLVLASSSISPCCLAL